MQGYIQNKYINKQKNTNYLKIRKYNKNTLGTISTFFKKHKSTTTRSSFLISLPHNQEFLKKIIINVGGTKIQSSNKAGKVVSEEGNFMRSLWRRTIFLIKEFGILLLRKIPRTEDSILISNGRESSVQGAWCNPKGDKGNLV